MTLSHPSLLSPRMQADEEVRKAAAAKLDAELAKKAVAEATAEGCHFNE